MIPPIRYNLHDGNGMPLNLCLKRGMAWAIYTDHGPKGLCGQSMSITCPHSVFCIWQDEQSMRDSLQKQFRHGTKANLQYGVIGEWSSGRGAVVVFNERGERAKETLEEGRAD